MSSTTHLFCLLILVQASVLCHLVHHAEIVLFTQSEEN